MSSRVAVLAHKSPRPLSNDRVRPTRVLRVAFALLSAPSLGILGFPRPVGTRKKVRYHHSKDEDRIPTGPLMDVSGCNRKKKRLKKKKDFLHKSLRYVSRSGVITRGMLSHPLDTADRWRCDGPEC